MSNHITPEIDRALRRALLSSVKVLGVIPRAAKADRNPKGGDAKQAPSRSDESGGRGAICPNDTGV